MSSQLHLSLTWGSSLTFLSRLPQAQRKFIYIQKRRPHIQKKRTCIQKTIIYVPERVATSWFSLSSFLRSPPFLFKLLLYLLFHLWSWRWHALKLAPVHRWEIAHKFLEHAHQLHFSMMLLTQASTPDYSVIAVVSLNWLWPHDRKDQDNFFVSFLENKICWKNG